MDAEGECFDYADESREQQEEEVIHGERTLGKGQRFSAFAGGGMVFQVN